MVSSRKQAFAKHLRRNETYAEKCMWKALCGLGFRRQVVIAGYVADFYSSKRKVAIEVDGPLHTLQPVYDAVRDRVFAKKGIKVIRVPASRAYRDQGNLANYMRARLGGSSGSAWCTLFALVWLVILILAIFSRMS